jgi:uncharacterized sulfatase
MKRREFLKATAAVAAAAHLLGRSATAAAEPKERPNILWLSAEDLSPTLGCYGDAYADTPALDRFAAQGVRYTGAFTHAPVCAPARSGIITGMYPNTIGTSWMRCGGVPPAEARCFPEYLRAAGYYCTNNSKTDYQFSPPPTAWDESSGSAHWRQRPRKDQPFFAVFNFGVTHESSTRRWKDGQQTHDPAKAPLPPYYPDTPVVRQNVACYYDRVSELDGQITRRLQELQDDGLADDTVVFFWGDHGWGLTRGKRWVYDSGIRVPLMVRVPEKWRDWAGAGDPKSVAPGAVTAEFARFLDFAPTVLSLAGVPIPAHMQGRAFLGPQKGKEPDYIYAARDRMDETYDCIRALRDKKYKYIRNFMPYLTRAQIINYMDQTPILKEMRRLHAAGQLKPGPQMQFFEPTKPVHELYDVTADPHEVRNLAADPKHRPVLERMEAALYAKMKAIGDVGVIPECDFDEMKGGGKTADPVFTVMAGSADGPQTVRITCPTPGAGIACRLVGKAEAGGDTVLLPAAQARIHGNGARKNGDYISNWRGKETYVTWQAEVPRGRLPVWVAQANAGEGGSVYELAVGDRTLTGTIRHTSDWEAWAWVRVGEVTLEKGGPCEIRITPVEQVQGRLGNLRAVALGGARPPAPRAAAGRWLLYHEPLTVRPGEQVQAKAARLGYRDSGTVTFRHGEAGSPPATPGPDESPWRRQINSSGMIGRILDLKAYDGRWTDGVPAYLKALADPAGPVRYWAVVGLHQAHAGGPPPKDVLEKVRALLKDGAASVPIAAAHALVDWGETQAGLDRLVEALSAPGEKTRLLAAHCLERLGKKALPARDAIEKAAKGQGGYPGRLLPRVVQGLKEG